jgi:L-lactate dehydrogenase (cytochrome)
MKNITCIEDLRRIARRKVPRAFFDYVEAGSYSEDTLRANRADLEEIKLRQHVMVGVAERDTSTTILGQKVALPLALAPVGMSGLQWGNGEILACRAARAAGIPYTLSTLSICSLEHVAEAAGAPFWFQLYVTKDRGFAHALIERAVAARCSALMLTVDLPVVGQRHCDIRNGLSVPPSLKLGNLLDMARRPRWVARILGGKSRSFGNLHGHLKGMTNVKSLSHWVSGQLDAGLSWKDLEWIRKLWRGPLIIKGILDVEDARCAVGAGANAIVVSNHGGRQLDGAPSSIAMLPKIAEAVGGETEVLFDGGVRSGQDVLRAVALGAKACLIGRAYIYGLGAGGEAGVAKAIDIIRRELDATMALTGCKSIADIGPHVLVR